MLKRTITSVCAIAVLLAILHFSHTWLYPVALATIILLALFEMFRCMGVHKNAALTAPLYVIGGAFPLLQRFQMLDQKIKVLLIAFVVMLAYVIYAFMLMILSKGKLQYEKVASLIFICTYIILGVNMLVTVRDYSDSGKYIYLFIFIGAWVPDTFAYLSGRLFGKHKLCEAVSPKKTVEGAIGGTLACPIVFVGVGFILNRFFGQDANFLFLGIGGVFIAILAQIGDLAMSVVKRHYNIKDFGKMFPGHGGVLDRFDSVLPVSLGVAAMCALSSVMGIPII